MNIHIEVHFKINGIGVLRKGSFRIKNDEVHTAYDFICQMQRDYPYDLILRKVIVNGDKDITDEVKKMFVAPLD